MQHYGQKALSYKFGKVGRKEKWEPNYSLYEELFKENREIFQLLYTSQSLLHNILSHPISKAPTSTDLNIKMIKI